MNLKLRKKLNHRVPGKFLFFYAAMNFFMGAIFIKRTVKTDFPANVNSTPFFDFFILPRFPSCKKKYWWISFFPRFLKSK